VSCGASASEYSCAHAAQINFRDLTPYLTYDFTTMQKADLLHRVFANVTLKTVSKDSNERNSCTESADEFRD
jgi:hypothetical protein